MASAAKSGFPAQLRKDEATMRYAMSVAVDQPFDEAVRRVRTALADQGFGVLTEIDVAATLKAKLGQDVPPQLILGACNPALAHRALTVEPGVGALLPCNVVVREDQGQVVVDTVDPEILVRLTERPELRPVAEEVAARLRTVLDRLS